MPFKPPKFAISGEKGDMEIAITANIDLTKEGWAVSDEFAKGMCRSKISETIDHLKKRFPVF